MKKVSKAFTKIDWKNARFEMTDGHLMVVEFDKEGYPIEETVFIEVIQDLIGEDGLTISIKKENDIDILLYKENRYHPVDKYSWFYAEKEIKLGEWYSFPFVSEYYSNTTENPIFIISYAYDSPINIYFREDYDYMTTLFTLENTNIEFSMSEILLETETEIEQLNYATQKNIVLHMSDAKELQVHMSVLKKDRIFYAKLNTDFYQISDEFLTILIQNDIIAF